MGATLLLGMLLPLLGIAALSGVVVTGQWSQRAVSTDLEGVAQSLERTVDLVADLAAEETYSTIRALSRDLRLGTDVGDRSLLEARQQVDASPVLAATIAEGDLRDFAEVRARLDRDEASYTEVNEVFGRLSSEVEARWRAEMVAIEEASDQRLSAGLRARLRTLRHSVEAFAPSSERIRPGLSILLGSAEPGALQELIRQNQRFEVAFERLDPVPGTAAAAAWEAFREDPDTQRIEELLDIAEQVGLGEAESPFAADLEPLVTAMSDGAEWALALAATVETAAVDLETAAAAAARDDTRAVILWTAAALALALTSVVIARITATTLVRPASALEAGARRVEHGDFDVAPIPPAGPREVRATVTAFNDMAATLAAVEEHAVALAENPDASVLREPLPGRTGRALQVALDVLRESMRQADQRRSELAELATHDGLTGLLNRRAAIDAVERDLARSRREGGRLFALFLDLDGLKALNDTYGHAVGDEAIRQFADALRSSTRDGDVVARIGGDEFLVAGHVPAEGTVAVETFAQRILRALRSQTVDVAPGTPLPLRCSLGMATSGEGVQTADGLLRSADRALYRAKEAGRDRAEW